MYMVPTWGHQLHEQEDAATQEQGCGHGISSGQVLQKQPGQYVRRDFNHCRKEAVHIDVPVQVRGIKGEAEVAHGYGHPETVQKKAGGAESTQAPPNLDNFSSTVIAGKSKLSLQGSRFNPESYFLQRKTTSPSPV